MKLKNTLSSFFLSVFCVSTALAHPGHHESGSIVQAFLHHVTSAYHSLMSLAVLGSFMLATGLLLALKRQADIRYLKPTVQRVFGAVLSLVGAGLLLGQLP